MNTQDIPTRINALKRQLTEMGASISYLSMNYYDFNYGSQSKDRFDVAVSLRGEDDQRFQAETADEAFAMAQAWADDYVCAEDRLAAVLGIERSFSEHAGIQAAE